uniref:Uncharacterized protein n=1 Tax=Anguilla anguilla TaxID=7936 RepID=A0A0E9WEQ0_ANGAN
MLYSRRLPKIISPVEMLSLHIAMHPHA